MEVIGKAILWLFGAFAAINLTLLALGSIAAVGYLLVHYSSELL